MPSQNPVGFAMIKFKYKTKDEAPKELHEFLKESTEKDGFEVSLALASKVDEFRNNNIRVSQEKDTLEKALKPFAELAGKDADGKDRPLADLLKDIEDWRKTAQLVKDGKLKGDDTIEKTITDRTKSMKDAYEDAVVKLGKDASEWKGKFEAAMVANNMKTIDSAIAQAASLPSVGLNMDALPDVLRRAREEWVVEGDKLVARKGEAVLRGEDGVTPLTVEEWFKGLRKSAGYYFKGSQGGGAGGGDGGSTDVDGNLTAADLAKMSPIERMQYANANPPKRSKR